MTDEKVFVGMQRPDWDEMADRIVANVIRLLDAGPCCFESSPQSIHACSCGMNLHCWPDVREHWQSGHMDVPVHIATEEACKIRLSLHSSGDNNQHEKVT